MFCRFCWLGVVLVWWIGCVCWCSGRRILLSVLISCCCCVINWMVVLVVVVCCFRFVCCVILVISCLLRGWECIGWMLRVVSMMVR